MDVKSLFEFYFAINFVCGNFAYIGNYDDCNAVRWYADFAITRL